MSAEAWAALAAVVTLLILVGGLAYRYALHEGAHKARVDKLEDELERERASSSEARAELERSLADYKSLLTDKTGVILRHKIDSEIVRAMRAMQVEAASVLIDAPPPGDETHLVFLSVHGPSANRIRKDLVDKNSIAGRVIGTGQSENLRDPQRTDGWNRAVDIKGEFKTRTLLTVPVQVPVDVTRTGTRTVIAACQFLNRKNGDPFDDQDEQIAIGTARRIAPLVQEFLSDERNYETLGIPLEQPYQEASVMFCDLTASTELLELMSTANAILRLDEYLESLGKIALAHGAKLFANLGDGMMLSFNVPAPLDDHPRKAVDAAWAMQQDFQRIWRGWQLFGLDRLHSRISIAVGPVVLANVGPKVVRQETIFGQVVNRSNKLCRAAPRDDDVIVVDEFVRRQVDAYDYKELAVPNNEELKLPPVMYLVRGPA